MSDSNNRYPDSTFSTEYPYNQATITRGGHEIHINDAPDNESLKISHTKGTLVEINKDGRWTQVVVEKAYNYFKDGLTETVDGHKDVKIAGNLNQNVDNSINDATGGDRSIASGGNMTVTTGGARYDHTSDDKTETIDGDNTVSINGDSYVSVTGDHVSHIGGVKKELVGGDVQSTVQGNYELINTDGVYRIKTALYIVEADAIMFKTTGGALLSLSTLINMFVPGSMYITTGGTATITAPTIHLNDV